MNAPSKNENVSETPEATPEAFVYRVPGPGGDGWMWIAHSVTGHAAHGRTPEGAAERLHAGLEALATVSGDTVESWRRSQPADRAYFVSRGELLQA